MGRHRRSKLASEESGRKRAHEAQCVEDDRVAAELQDAEQRRRAVQAEADSAALQSFLSKHRFSGPNAKRTSLLKHKYPLHTAVKLGDASMIRVLLGAQAEPALKNSA